MIAIAEISGADSIAAALRFAEQHPGARLVPTYASTGTEYGDFSQIEANVAFLREQLPARGAVLEGELARITDPSLWRALCGRHARAMVERFGSYLPCAGCHLYLHLMRVPIAQDRGATCVVSGEREHHGTRTKANQTSAALDTYVAVLAEAGIELALPIREVTDSTDIKAILGPRWTGGSPQLECVLKGNETGPDGSCVHALPQGFAEEFLLPAGRAVARQMLEGDNAWDTAVDPLVRPAAADAV